ncbi:MAG: c-type cytochrome [Chromatocurvus sp.]
MGGLSRIINTGPALAFGLVALLTACSEDNPPVTGFVLPEGNVEQGKAAFVALGCPQCHTVADSDIGQPENPDFQVVLGGRLIQVENYGDLLTSIVNPSHRVAPQLRLNNDADSEEGPVSPMPDFTPTMTVAQLIDVVEFLHSKYTQLPRYSGRYYHYPL